MSVSMPSINQLLSIAKDKGLELSSEEAASYRGLMAGTIASYKRLDTLPEAKLPVVAPRDPGYRPDAKENPFNAWYWKTDIKLKDDGLLAGKSVAIKDNICVAGVPLMNGSALLEGSTLRPWSKRSAQLNCWACFSNSVRSRVCRS